MSMRRIRVMLGRIAALLALAAMLPTWVACGQPASGRFAHTAAPPTATPAASATGTPLPTPVPEGGWIPLASHSDAAILAAVRQSSFFQFVAATPPGTEGSWDVAHLGAPVYVAAYRAGAHVPQPSYDYYIVPGYDAAGQITDLIPAKLNQAHSAIAVDSIGGYGPASSFPSSLVSASQAVSIVERQRHTTLRAGTQPSLIYLAAYDTGDVETGRIKWNGGGGGPQNPIWLVPGADGQDHFVGTDGNAYSLSQLPLMS